VVGEICVAGPACALGYVDDPALTAARFVIVESKDGAQHRAFHTGDLGSVDFESGLLRHHGRLDDQVKVRGVRVEPKEVEAALAADARVHEAVVIAWKKSGSGSEHGSAGEPLLDEDTCLVAFATCQPADVLDSQARSEILSCARSLLPPQAVPAYLFALRELPHTRSGKLDRAALGDKVPMHIAASQREASSREGRAVLDDGTRAGGSAAAIREAVRSHALAYVHTDDGETSSFDKLPLAQMGLTSLNGAAIVHDLWLAGWELPMEALLGVDATVASLAGAATLRKLERKSCGPIHITEPANVAARRTRLGSAASGHSQSGEARWWSRANLRGGRETTGTRLSPCLVRKTITMRQVWKVDMHKCVDASPLVVAYPEERMSCVFIGSHSGFMRCLDLADGTILWERLLPDRIESSASIALRTSRIAVGCYDHGCYCLDAASGDVAWCFRSHGEIKASPCTVVNRDGHEHIWIGSFDRNVYVLNASTGALVASAETSSPIYASPVHSASTGLVIVANLRGDVIALDEETCAARWTLTSGHAIFASPRVDEHAQALLLGTVDGVVRAHAISDGCELWTCSAALGPIFATPCWFVQASTPYACVASQDGGLTCIGWGGELVWQVLGPGKGHSAPSVEDSMVAIADAEGTVRLLRAVDGAELARTCIPCPVHSSVVLLARQDRTFASLHDLRSNSQCCARYFDLIVGCRDNNVYSYELRVEPDLMP